MKRILLLFLCFTSCLMHSQISSGNMYKIEGVKSVEIDFGNFNQLTLDKSSNSNIITVFCTNCTSENLPKVEKDGSLMSITVPKEKEIPNTHQNKFRAGQPLYPDYEINIPNNLSVGIVYNQGNFLLKNFGGSLDLNLNEGKLSINPFLGKININSFAGIINCNLLNTYVEVENSKGKLIENDKPVKLTSDKIKHISLFGKDNSSLTIKTIKAKVILNTYKE